jgi:hypothetical protein
MDVYPMKAHRARRMSPALVADALTIAVALVLLVIGCMAMFS